MASCTREQFELTDFYFYLLIIGVDRSNRTRCVTTLIKPVIIIFIAANVIWLGIFVFCDASDVREELITSK